MRVKIYVDEFKLHMDYSSISFPFYGVDSDGRDIYSTRAFYDIYNCTPYYVGDLQFKYTYKNKKYKETYSELCGTSVNCNEGSVCAECILFDPGKTYYWTLSKDENTFKRSEVGTVGNFYDEITILKLSNNSYWYSYNKVGVKYEYRLKRFK